MNISSQGNPLVDPFCGFSSQGSNTMSGSQEMPGFSQEWLGQGIMPSQTDSQNLQQKFDFLTDFINKDYDTTENDLKSSQGDNVSSQKFYPYSANSQETLQTPDFSRPPAPVVGSQPSVVSSWQPSVNQPARYTPSILNRSRLHPKKRHMEQYCKEYPVEVSSSDKPIIEAAARAIVSLSQGSRNSSTPPDWQSDMSVTFTEEQPFMGQLQSSKPVGRVKRGTLDLFTISPPKRVRANSVSSTVTTESESRSELSSLDDLDEPSEVSSTTSGYLHVISPRPHKQVKAYGCKAPTKAQASSKKSSKLSPQKTYIKTESSQPSRYSSSSISSSSSSPGRLRNPSTSSTYSNVSTSSNASSTVNTKNMTKEERELYEKKKADKKERNKEASKRLRDKRKQEAISGAKSIEEWEKKNTALGEQIEEFERSKANLIQKLLQIGVTKEEIRKKLQLLLAKSA